jgi:hypothetical protein
MNFVNKIKEAFRKRLPLKRYKFELLVQQKGVTLQSVIFTIDARNKNEVHERVAKEITIKSGRVIQDKSFNAPPKG